MLRDNLKSAWSQFKWTHSHDVLSHEEVLALIEPKTVNRTRSVLVNLLMLLSLLLTCY